MKRAVGIATVLGVLLGAAFPAVGGMTPDPRPGDTDLGKRGGVAYVSDSDFASAATFVETGAACPDTPGPWRISGGGFSVTGGADSTQQVAASTPADLLDFYGDNDLKLDDYWRLAADVSIGTTATSYAICTKWSGLKQRRVVVDDSPWGERKVMTRCKQGRVSGGGGSISTGDSYVSSMSPRGAKRWRFAAFDTANGIGGMDNYLVCARGRDFQIVKAKLGVPGGQSSALAIAECFPGQSVVGGGVKTSGAPGTLSLRESRPYDSSDADAIPSNGWAARAFSTDPGAQTITAFAICED